MPSPLMVNLFLKYLLSAFYVPVSALCAMDTEKNKASVFRWLMVYEMPGPDGNNELKI